MKKYLSVVISLVTILSSTVYAKELYEVTSSRLNMREGLSIEAPAIRTLPKSHIVEIDKNSIQIVDNEEWIQVTDGDGVQGWVRFKYLKKYEKDKIVGDTGKRVITGLDEKTVDKIIDKLMPPLPKDEIIDREEKFQVAKKNTSKKPIKNADPINTEQNMVFIEGEGLHRVKIALKDLNRITCSSKIGDPIYSKDKQIEIVRGGDKDLFVKISPIQKTYGGVTETIYSTFPREVYVECGAIVYNLSLIPVEDIPSQTIVFKSPINDIKKAMNFEKSSAYEEIISELIKSAYIEQQPAGYSVKRGSLKHQFNELDMRLRYIYTGYEYIIEDWEITSKIDKEIEIEENIFVPVLKNPRAITLTVPRLNKGEVSRLLVVRLANKDK